MADQLKPESPVDWLGFFSGTASFVWGFFLGGATGYFGNWLWEKFKPRKKHGHLVVEADGHGTYFSGRMTPENKEQILKTLRASTVSTGKPKIYDSSGTGGASVHGARGSTN